MLDSAFMLGLFSVVWFVACVLSAFARMKRSRIIQDRLRYHDFHF